MSLETIIEVDETGSVLVEKEAPFLPAARPRKNWAWLQALKYTIIAALLLSFMTILLVVFVRKYKAV
jgi:hypothetical protein